MRCDDNIYTVTYLFVSGGKTAQLLSSGLRVVAVESSARRVRRLGENLDRLKLAEKCIIKNCLGQSWLPEEHVDGILLDGK